MVTSLHMGWRHVLFANWPVDPGLLDAHLPSALSVDTYDSDAWLSVVPFTNVDVRPTWLPDGWGLPLPELNLRPYVTHDGHHGVYFFSLDAQGILGVGGARLFHHLPYYYARCSLAEDDGRIRFKSRRLLPVLAPFSSSGPTTQSARSSIWSRDRSKNFSPSATGTTQRRKTARCGMQPSTMSRGHCTRPTRRSRPTRCSRLMGLRTRSPSQCTTTVLA